MKIKLMKFVIQKDLNHNVIFNKKKKAVFKSQVTIQMNKKKIFAQTKLALCKNSLKVNLKEKRLKKNKKKIRTFFNKVAQIIMKIQKPSNKKSQNKQ